MTVVLANGCFDILHIGHVAHLQQARSMGDYLIVSLTTDYFVNKGPHRPINKWQDRASVLEALRCVDQVIPTVNAVAAIEAVRPDVFVKGIDYAGGDLFTEDVVQACERVGAKLVFTTTPKKSAAEIIRKAIA
jgi:rfaE bifunctional protein nucleotidyltransferase chain/domain